MALLFSPMPQLIRRMPGHRARWAAAAMLCLHIALLVWSAFVHSPTWDEPMHLAGGIRHLQFGAFDVDRGNPPLVASAAAAAALFAEPIFDWTNAENGYIAGADFTRANGSRICWLIAIGRLPCILFSILGGIVCYRWASDLYGQGAGLTALCLWCFCPFILGHGALITADVAAAAIGTAACYLFRKWLRECTFAAALVAGAALAAAEATKYVWVILYALWPALWLAWLSMGRGQPIRPRLHHLALIMAIGVYGTNLAYLCTNSFEPAGAYPFLRQVITRGVAQEGDPDLAAATSKCLLAAPIPLPRDYVLGACEVTELVKHQHRCYLRGEWQTGGWWHYYLYGLAAKLPLGTLGLFALAVALQCIPRRRPPVVFRETFLVLSLPAALLLFVTLLSGCHHHVRYALPALPFMLIFAGAAMHRLPGARPWYLAVVRLGVLSSLASSLAAYPHSISYFNELAGGPLRGDEHLVDSNFDWGQDLLYLKRWHDEHPEATPLSVAYFGPVNPRAIGMQFDVPPKFFASRANGVARRNDGPRPGWHAVSASWAHGYTWRLPTGDGGFEMLGSASFEYFLKFRPVARAGYSIFIYHISLTEANAVRRELGLPLLTTHE